MRLTARAPRAIVNLYSEETTIAEAARLNGRRPAARGSLAAAATITARRKPDITCARELLGWEPRTPLRDGLKHTLAWRPSARG